jgi:hypothetical protein
MGHRLLHGTTRGVAIMHAEQINAMVRGDSFLPLEVRLDDGRAFTIASPEHVVVGTRCMAIGLQADDEPFGICASVVKVPIERIRSIRPQAAATSRD